MNIKNNDMNSLHGCFIKYDTLKCLIDTNYTGSDATCINMVFDLGSMLYHIRNSNLEMCGFGSEDSNVLAATVINMVAHYRYFFKSKFGVDTKFFIIFPNGGYKENLNKNTKYMTSRNSIYFKKNSNILKTIVPYIEGVWYSGFSGFEPMSKIMEIIEFERSNGNRYPWLLLTKDTLLTQLLRIEDLFVIRPRKDLKTKTDTSYIINNENYLRCLKDDFKSKSNISYVPVNALGLLFTLTKVERRGIPSLVSLAKASQIINKELNNNTLQVNLTKQEAERLCKEYNLRVDPDVLLCRHWYVDATCVYAQYEHMRNYIGIIDLYVDQNKMIEMFDELFPNTIIDYLAL